MTGPYGAQRISQPGQEMPAPVMIAMIVGVLISAFWGFCALTLFAVVGQHTVSAAPLILVVLFAVGMNVLGVVGVARRWEWVRWAALLQSAVFTVVLCAWGLRWVSITPPLLLLFALHAVMQFLPVSHRWFRFRPPRP